MTLVNPSRSRKDPNNTAHVGVKRGSESMSEPDNPHRAEMEK